MYEIEKIKELAPAAFRSPEEGAEKGVSKHYQFMTTAELINGLGSLGWSVYSASQQKSKKNPETTKHMLRFRNSEYGSFGVDGNVPEILLVNSHDRTTSLNFHVGIFRVICSNGLVVADETFSKLNIRHMGYTFEDVKANITQITENLPVVFNSINKFQSIFLDKNQETEFMVKSLAIRYPEYINPKTNKLNEQLIKKSVDLDDMLKPLRPEDSGNDLWTVFNKTQEKILKGGFKRIGCNNTIKTVRPITNIRLNILINKGIWDLTNQFYSFGVVPQ